VSNTIKCLLFSLVPSIYIAGFRICFSFNVYIRYTIRFKMYISNNDIYLVTKFNYNLYIHVKIIVLNLYIKSLHQNIQIILYFTSVKNFMCKKLQMLKCKK